MVTSPASVTPWKPAMMTTRPALSSRWMRLALMRFSRALVWAVSVTMPICPAVKLIASTPMSCSAMAIRLMVTCSPVAINWSHSRLCGSEATWWASSSNWSVVLPMAETTMATW